MLAADMLATDIAPLVSPRRFTRRESSFNHVTVQTTQLAVAALSSVEEALDFNFRRGHGTTLKILKELLFGPG